MQTTRIVAVVLGLLAVALGGCTSRSASVRDDSMSSLQSERPMQQPSAHMGAQSEGSSDKTGSKGGGLTTSLDKGGVTPGDNLLSLYPQKNRSQDSGTVKPELDTASAPNHREQLGTIHFDFDSSVLTGNAREILQKNARILKNNGRVKIRIEGNCDERGSDEYNLALGEKRAKAAMQYLVTLGTEPGRLSFISYGKEKPVESGHNDIAWALNRRDDFVVIGK